MSLDTLFFVGRMTVDGRPQISVQGFMQESGSLNINARGSGHLDDLFVRLRPTSVILLNVEHVTRHKPGTTTDP